MQSIASVSSIVIHCSATPPSEDIGWFMVDMLHRSKGWNGCGYHYVIRRNGVLELGRPEGVQGAHAKGHNHNSIALCLIGGVASVTGSPENNYTTLQWETLDALMTRLMEKYPHAEIVGHRDLPNVNKACPCFDVQEYLENGVPLHDAGIY